MTTALSADKEGRLSQLKQFKTRFSQGYIHFNTVLVNETITSNLNNVSNHL